MRNRRKEIGGIIYIPDLIVTFWAHIAMKKPDFFAAKESRLFHFVM